MKLTRPIYRLKRDARIAARTKDIPLHSALNRVAADEGFVSWSLLAACHADMSPEAAFYQRLRAGNLALIGGRPGQGKTMMALKLAREALNGGNASMFFTLEYSLQGVADRLKQLDMPVGSERRFQVDCSNDICADYIAGKMRTARRGTLAVIDYLQILDQKREKPPIEIQVRSLKAFAESMGQIIVFLSQIDRSFETSGRTCPDMSDVRLPNPLDLSLFDHCVFLHAGQMEMKQNRFGAGN